MLSLTERPIPEPVIAEFAEVKKFRFDVDIQASDGEAGKLVAIIMEGDQPVVSHIGVHVGGFFRRTSVYYVPLDLVTDANANTVTLSIPLDEIEKHVATPSGLALTSRTTVVAGGKTLARLAQVTVHSHTRMLRHLVVERGLGREYLVPATMVKSITARQITVDLGGTSADRLTPYRDDEELRQEVFNAIYDYARLRVDLPGIQIFAIDGVIWLKGHVASDLNRVLVADQLGGIVGLAELHNELVADNELAAAVSMALAKDPRTAGQRIGVYPKLGEVHLRGNVRTAEARTTATEVARGVPGVKTVMNELHVNPSADVVPVLAGVTNEEDVVPG
ncbi:MAG: BON domain-containing protein [Ktedonobacterales bacterium]